MQPTNEHPFPIDYLEEISTAPKKSKALGSNKLFFGIIGAGLIIALFVGVFAFLNAGPSTTSSVLQLKVRLANLQSIADASQAKIANSKLRAANKSLSLVLANANRDIQPHVAATGVDPAKIDPKIIAGEDTSKLIQSLENARLNAAFDRTYAREMDYQLNALSALLEQIEKSTKNASLKEFTHNTREQVEPIKKQFSEFNAAN